MSRSFLMISAFSRGIKTLIDCPPFIPSTTIHGLMRITPIRIGSKMLSSDEEAKNGGVRQSTGFEPRPLAVSN